MRSVGFVRDRHWTDPRDGVGWMLWLEIAADRPILAFGSDGDIHKVVVDFERGWLWNLSDEDLQRFLDEAKFSSTELGLPRSASAEEPGVETLPRTAAEFGPDRGTLPRAVEVGEEDDEKPEG